MSAERIRLSALADEIGFDFSGLFRVFCKMAPDDVDNDLTVPARWREILKVSKP